MKTLKTISGKRNCAIVADWDTSIRRHLYWCATSTPDGNEDMVAAKFSSYINHVHNIHHGHNEHYQDCMHADLVPGARRWIEEGKCSTIWN